MCNLGAGIMEQGIELGRILSMLELLDSGVITLEQILKILNMSEEQLNEKRKKLLTTVR